MLMIALRWPLVLSLLLAAALPARGQISFSEPPDLAGQNIGSVTAGLNTIQGSVGTIVLPPNPPSGDVHDSVAVDIPGSLAITGAELVITNYSSTSTLAYGRIQVQFADPTTVFATSFTGNGTILIPTRASNYGRWLGTGGTQTFQVSAELDQGGSIAFSYQIRLTVQPDFGACCTGGLGGACTITALSACGNNVGAAQWLLGATCTPNICPQTNDRCLQPITITAGSTPFSTINATTDGPSHPGTCDFFGSPGIARDIWYRFTMPADGVITLATCGSAFDTELAVYAGPNCPQSSAFLLACNDDDGSVCTPGAGHSRIAGLALDAGDSCLIRVGGYEGSPAGGASGIGTLTLDVITIGACCNRWTGHCLNTTKDDCLALGLRFFGFGSVCSPAICHACPADFNGSGSQTIDDLFLYLNAYFAGCP